MPNYCTVCGRELTKTAGPIGPKCLQKLQPRNRRVRGLTKKQYEKLCAKYDMYYGENNGQTEDDTSSESPEGQKTGPDGETGKTVEATS